MMTKEKFSVRAPIQDVWDFMADPEKLGSCIPGFEGIEAIGENAYKSTLRIKLPIFSITVESTTTVTEAIPPRRLKSITQGRYDLGGGTFHQETLVELEEKSDREVEVSYSTETKLDGGLAGFSDTIMGGMAKGLAQQFADNIRSRLEKG